MLKGKVVLITGVTSGIGWATAVKCCKEEGACVFGTGRNEDRLKELVKILPKGRISTMACNIEVRRTFRHSTPNNDTK